MEAHSNDHALDAVNSRYELGLGEKVPLSQTNPLRPPVVGTMLRDEVPAREHLDEDHSRYEASNVRPKGDPA